MTYPSNSKHPRKEEDRKVEQVVTGEAIARKKGLGRKFSEVFFGGDHRNALQVVLMEVVIPQVKELLAESVITGMERVIFGETRGPRRNVTPGRGASHQTNYNRYSTPNRPTPGRPPAVVNMNGKAVDDIFLGTRVEAQAVLDRMFMLIQEYGTASIADLYSLVGWTSTYMDGQWGWTDLDQATSRATQGGWMLSFPNPERLS